MICPTGKAEYFSREDWTTQITLIRFNKFAFTRKTEKHVGKPKAYPAE